MLAGQQPHRPKNNLGIAGVETIFESNLHFSYDNVDALGDKGYAVFIQDSLSGLPYLVHQVTSGVITAGLSNQEESEISVVQNFDYVSVFFKNRLAPYVGVWNIIPNAFGSVESTLTAAILDLKSRTTSRIGAPLISGVINFVKQSASDSGTMEAEVEVKIPKVLNTLKLSLISK